MMKVKYILKMIGFALVLFYATSTKAQDNNDILIGVYVPDNLASGDDNIPSSAVGLLTNRLYQIVTKNGVSGNLYSPRFFLLPRVVVLEKIPLATAPPTIVLHLDLTLLVADNKEEKSAADDKEEKGNIFHVENIQVKGVGKNPDKAFINAFRNLKYHNAKLVAFLDKSKSEIIKYYEENCDIITKKANALTAQRKAKDAVRVIANIPLSSKCYSKNERVISALYREYLKQDCDDLLNQARAAWYTDQTSVGAREAGEILKRVAPRAMCKDEVLKLYKIISKRILEISGEKWNLRLKKVDIQNREDQLKLMRDLVLKSLDQSTQPIIGTTTFLKN